MDGRSDSMVVHWANNGFLDRVRAISGWNIHPGLPLATIAWLRDNNPAVFNATRRWLCMNDYIAYRLTGQFAMNPSNGGVTQLMRADRLEWSEELCSMAGARPEQFSPIVESGQTIGILLRDVCNATGLPYDLKVISGGHDQSCTAVALAVWQPGQVLLACGTSWVVTGVAGEPHLSALPQAFDLNYHAMANCWTVSQSLGGLGASLEWLVRLCWREQPSRRDSYLALDNELMQTMPGSDGLFFMPMSGGHVSPAGMQYGGYVKMHPGHMRCHMARAILESSAYELKLALDAIDSGQLRVDSLSMAGGATRSSVWPGIIADVTGLPLRVTSSAHLPAVGAAIIASVGCGVYGELREAQTHFIQPSKEFAPEVSKRAIYDEYLKSYCRYIQLLS
jgi:xylulokinase